MLHFLLYTPPQTVFFSAVQTSTEENPCLLLFPCQVMRFVWESLKNFSWSANCSLPEKKLGRLFFSQHSVCQVRAEEQARRAQCLEPLCGGGCPSGASRRLAETSASSAAAVNSPGLSKQITHARRLGKLQLNALATHVTHPFQSAPVWFMIRRHWERCHSFIRCD